jgi:tripartite-type tricarboxylate transporter receptor subunit TctC
MKLARRKFLQLAACAAAVPAAAARAWAQSYPTRPVHIIVGASAGGAPDIYARLVGQWLAERLGQPFVVDDRPGAGTNLATEAVVRASPDGYTLLATTLANAVNATLYPNLNFNFIRDIAPIASMSREPLAMEVKPSFPAATVPEFIAYAKANPGKLSAGSAGAGTSLHMAFELFKLMAGVELVHVPYRSSAAALTDLLGGQVQMMFGPLPSTIGHIKSREVRALAVTTAARSPALPDIPTVGDFVPGYEASAVYGIGAPKNTSAEIIALLNKEINAGLADPKLKARLDDLGSSVLAGSPSDFSKLIAEETEKWGTVVKSAGIRVD